MKKGMRRSGIFCAICFLLLAGVLILGKPVESQAASRLTKTRAARAYRNFLYESDYRCFRLFDMNKDGIKELLVSHDDPKYMVSQLYIYTYRNGAVRRVGDTYSMFGFEYNKKTRYLMGKRGGGGSIENWYYTISRTGKLQQHYLQAIEYFNGKRMSYRYYYKGKKISRKTYQAKLKSWERNSVSLNFYKMSVSNIKKRVKM